MMILTIKRWYKKEYFYKELYYYFIEENHYLILHLYKDHREPVVARHLIAKEKVEELELCQIEQLLTHKDQNLRVFLRLFLEEKIDFFKIKKHIFSEYETIKQFLIRNHANLL